MSGLSEERRKEIEGLIQSPVSETVWTTADLILAIRDLLAESAALRTERDALERQKAATNEALADALELAAHNGLAAPASPDDLARVTEIRERLGKATMGPWRRDETRDGWSILSPEGGRVVATGAATEANRDFIAHAREDIPFLLARLTPPTGTAAGNAGETRTKESKS